MRDLASTKEELHALAEEPSLAVRKDALVTLAGALGSDEAHHWAKVDLFTIFDEDVVSDPAVDKAAVRASWLELARNITILLPLLITWVGIAQATRAYGQLLQTDPAAGRRPFVQLWEEGFDGRTWTFSAVGTADVVAILIVVLLSVGVGVARRHLDITIPSREREVWNQLQAALIDASIHLARASFDSPMRFNEALTSAVVELDRVNTQVRASAATVNTMIESAQTALAGIDEGGRRLAEATETYTEGAAETREGLKRVEQELVALEGRFETAADALRGVADRQQEFSGRLDQALKQSTSSAGDVVAATAKLMASMTTQGDTARDLLRATQAERHAQEASAHALAATAQEFKAGAASLQEVLDRARQLSDTSAQTSEQLEAMAGAIKEGIGGVDEALGPRLEAVGKQIAQLAEEVRASLATSLEQQRVASADAQQQVVAVLDRVDATTRLLGTVAERFDGADLDGQRTGLIRRR